MRLELPDHKVYTHQMVIPIRWGDMDALGHVNNTVYFRYFESLRVEWLAGRNAAPNPSGVGPVIVNAFCNFIQQLTFPGDVLAKHFVANPGRSSFDTYMTLERADQPGVICATAGAKVVWVDLQQQKSVPLPEWLRAELTAGAA